MWGCRFYLTNVEKDSTIVKPVIPTPVHFEKNEDGYVNIRTGDWVVVSLNSEAMGVAVFLAGDLNATVL